MMRPSRPATAPIIPETAVSRNTGATASWMQCVMAVLSKGEAIRGVWRRPAHALRGSGRPAPDGRPVAARAASGTGGTQTYAREYFDAQQRPCRTGVGVRACPARASSYSALPRRTDVGAGSPLVN